MFCQSRNLRNFPSDSCDPAQRKCLKKKPGEQFTYEYLPDIFLTTAIMIPARIPTATMIPTMIPTSAIVPRPPERRNWECQFVSHGDVDKRLLTDPVLLCCIPLLGEISHCLVNSAVGLGVQQPASGLWAEGLHEDAGWRWEPGQAAQGAGSASLKLSLMPWAQERAAGKGILGSSVPLVFISKSSL